MPFVVVRTTTAISADQETRLKALHAAGAARLVRAPKGPFLSA